MTQIGSDANRGPTPLEVLGSLSVVIDEMPDHAIQVELRGTEIALLLSSVASLRALNRVPLPGKRRQWISRFHDGLCLADLRLIIFLGDEVIGRLGPESRPGLASQLLGVSPLELRLGTILRKVITG